VGLVVFLGLMVAGLLWWRKRRERRMRYKLVSDFHDDQDPLVKKFSQYGFYAEELELPPRTPLGYINDEGKGEGTSRPADEDETGHRARSPSDFYSDDPNKLSPSASTFLSHAVGDRAIAGPSSTGDNNNLNVLRSSHVGSEQLTQASHGSSTLVGSPRGERTLLTD